MTVHVLVPREQAHKQRMDALKRANEVRLSRAQLKRDIKARKVNPLDVLVDPPVYAEGMFIIDLLLAMPFVGRTKALGLLGRIDASPRKTVGALTARQRMAVAAFMEGRR